MYNFEETYPKFKKLEQMVEEVRGYIERNARLIQNYRARWPAGPVISTAFVESLVNSSARSSLPITSGGPNYG